MLITKFVSNGTTSCVVSDTRHVNNGDATAGWLAITFRETANPVCFAIPNPLLPSHSPVGGMCILVAMLIPVVLSLHLQSASQPRPAANSAHQHARVLRN